MYIVVSTKSARFFFQILILGGGLQPARLSPPSPLPPWVRVWLKEA